MDDDDPDSQFFITDLESDLYNVIQEIRNDEPPLEIRKDLYTTAHQHALNCYKKLHRNVKEGFESRRNLFRNAKRYMEINFVTKPLESDPISFISNILKSHYISRIQSQINSIGPVTMKLKSNKYVVVILAAYFAPIFSVRQFFVYFPKIREMEQSSNDLDALIDLMNHFRKMHNFKPFTSGATPPKAGSYKNMLTKTVSYESKKVSDLFCRLFTDQTFIDLIGEMWTDFSYSIEKGDSNSLLKMKLYRDDEEYIYTIDVKHPIYKNQLDKIYSKYMNSKDNGKINNNNDIHLHENPFGRDNIINEKAYEIQPRNITNESPEIDAKDNNLSGEVEEAIHILNDNTIEKIPEIESEINSPLNSKRSAWHKYEPTGSTVPQTVLLAQKKEVTPTNVEPKRHNSTSSLLFSKKIAQFDSGKINLSPKKTAWGNLKPSLNNLPSIIKTDENLHQQEQDSQNGDSKNDESHDEETISEKDNDENNKEKELESYQDDNPNYMSDSSEVLLLQPKQRSNSQTISLLDTVKSPWRGIPMTGSDEPLEPKEIRNIPTGLRSSQIKMLADRPSSGIPVPSKISTPLSARPLSKGWSSLKIGKPPISNSVKKQQQQILSPPKIEADQNEISHPQKQIIKHSSNAWSRINPEISQKDLLNHQIDLNSEGDIIDNNNFDENEKNNDSENTNYSEGEMLVSIPSSSETESDKEREFNSEEENVNKNANKKPLILKGTHKAKMSTLGQSFKKTSPVTVKKKQPIKTITGTTNIHDLSPTKASENK